MTDLRRPFSSLGVLILVLAACGGGGGGSASTAPTDGTAGAAPTQETASQAPATAAPSDVTTATEQPGGGGTAGGVCDLVTADELAAIFGVASVTQTVFQGPPDTCSVDSDAGDPLVAWSYSAAAAKPVYEAFVSDPQSVEVAGIGDKAAFVQNTGLLVLKGDALAVIGVASGDEEIAKQIGAIAADRM